MKRVVPIVSSSVKYFGLTVPEWAISILPIAVFSTFLSKLFWIYLPVHFIALVAYARILGKMEENILAVIGTWSRISPVMYGYFSKPIPTQKFKGTGK